MLVTSIAAFVGSGIKSQVLDTSILDTRGGEAADTRAGKARAARGIAAEPP
jgi:hypothetical protein